MFEIFLELFEWLDLFHFSWNSHELEQSNYSLLLCINRFILRYDIHSVLTFYSQGDANVGSSH